MLAHARTITVNSLHSQGIDRLGDGLAIEASAPDKQIEAVRVREAKSFAIGVQWHQEDTTDFRVFAAFVEAARARRDSVAAR